MSDKCASKRTGIFGSENAGWFSKRSESRVLHFEIYPNDGFVQGVRGVYNTAY